MLKISIILMLLLVAPGTLGAQYITGQTIPMGPGSSYTTLRDSDGGSATIMVTPPGQISIRTNPGTTIEDVQRAQQGASQAIRELNRQLHGDASYGDD